MRARSSIPYSRPSPAHPSPQLGGSNLYDQWRAGTGDLYQWMIAQTTLAMANKVLGGEMKLRGMIWVQVSASPHAHWSRDEGTGGKVAAGVASTACPPYSLPPPPLPPDPELAPRSRYHRSLHCPGRDGRHD